ncbi:MAG: hypothetical protein AAF927_13670 [Bacteroidota bacterium]
MKKDAVYSLLQELTGSLEISTQESGDQIIDLRAEIVKALNSQDELQGAHPIFQFERTDQMIGGLRREDTPADELENLFEEAKTRGLAEEGDDEYRVFRRSSPVRSPQIPGSTPDWGKGAEVAFSRGPFRDRNGLWYWFDFFKITRKVAVYFQGATAPVLLLPVKLSIFTSSRSSYKLGKGSVWIRANFFDNASPANTYVGLKIEGGELEFSQVVSVNNNRVNIALNSKIELTLELDPEASQSTYSANTGIDARKASIDLPTSCRFNLDGSGLSITDIGSGSWKLYADGRNFSFLKGNAAYNSILDHILIDVRSEPGNFKVQRSEVGSKLIDLNGVAPVSRSFWALPLTTINNPSVLAPEAEGIGAWGLQLAKGLTIDWIGMEAGPVALRKCWVILKPGHIEWVVPSAANIHAKQTYDLWQNEANSFLARAILQYNGSFPLRYQSLSLGAESILTQCDTEIETDRPVRVNGSPFEAAGKETVYYLFEFQEERRILLYDPNIMQDNLDVNDDSPSPYEANAIALNNVLLTTSQVLAYLLVGTLASATKVEVGNLHFLHALFRMLPTLPDPYAANLDRLAREQSKSYNNDIVTQIPIAYLLATVTWPSNIPSEEPQNAAVSYQFFPFKQRERTYIGLENVGVGQFISSSQVADTARTANSNAAADIIELENQSTYNPEEYEEPWNRLRTELGRDLFALLDVSTNADLMGVMYSVMNERYLYKVTHAPKSKLEQGVPIEIEGMDLKASGKYAKAFTVPLVSWEPVLNTSDISVLPADPPGESPENPRQLRFPNDGGPTKIFNTSLKTVTLAPIPLSKFIIKEFEGDDEPLTFSVFTLPFGMQAAALFEKTNPFGSGPASALSFNRPNFDAEVEGGIQFKATGAYNPLQNNRNLRGNTIQLTNLISTKANATSILGESVTEIFNREFGLTPPKTPFMERGVPVERIDMSGYGASMFSNWLNDKAKFAQTSQAKFDVITGRTAHEIIQVRSMIYPWGIGVVRTIVMYRPSSGFVYRVDSGWRADSDGLFDFNVNIKEDNAGNLKNDSQFEAVSDPFDIEVNGEIISFQRITPYEFHPGIIKGVYKVKNIEETLDLEPYVNNNTPSSISLNDKGELVYGDFKVNVKLQPVWFTADIEMDFVKKGAVGGRVPSKKMLGFIQIGPEGVPIPTSDFVSLLERYPAIGGEVDCLIDIGDSGQKMRLKRVEMDPALNAANRSIFVGTPKGTPILPADGSWSLVQSDEGTGEVTPVADVNGIPLIRAGKLVFDTAGNVSVQGMGKNLRIANARELIKVVDPLSISFGFLQNTGTQKVLFRRPNFEQGLSQLNSELPDYADAYHLLNSKGIFPNLSDITEQLDLVGNGFDVEIIGKGYQLVSNGVASLFNHPITGGRWYWVGSEIGDEVVKIYVDYSLEETTQNNTRDAALDFELDSLAEKWTSDLNSTTISIDLAEISPLFVIKGNFESKDGLIPAIKSPTLEFGPTLQPIAEVLTLLIEISKLPDTNYAALLEKGLEIAMSNSPEVWEYKFSAKKEIPVLRFPPPALDSPASPLRIEASLSVGCYFNESISLTSDLGSLVPSAGAFVEFYGQLSVMCVSLAAATVYAVGQTRVKIYADLEEGPGLEMEYGFGVELAVGLPVIGTVALTYMVGIGMQLDASNLQVDAFLLFKGRAEILGGIVTVNIMIEARGSVDRALGSGRTDMIAQVTFGLEISIFLVIDLSFEESWQERRQIA